MVATLLHAFMHLSEVKVRTCISDLAFVLAGCKFSFLENHDNFGGGGLHARVLWCGESTSHIKFLGDMLVFSTVVSITLPNSDTTQHDIFIASGHGVWDSTFLYSSSALLSM
jgi:hypothetical protein